MLSQLTGQCMSMVQALGFALSLLEDFAPKCLIIVFLRSILHVETHLVTC